MKQSYFAKYKSIKIKPLIYENIEDMRILRNKNRNFFVSSKEISSEQQEKWFQNYIVKEDDYLFSVFYEDIWIGTVSIYDIKDDCAEFGRLMIDKTKVNKKGLGMESTICVCNLAFEKLGIKNIHLEVYKDNIAAIKTYQCARFSIVGECIDNYGRPMLNMILKRERGK